MHKYLKTIGFTEYDSSKKVRTLKEEVMKQATRKATYPLENGEYCFSYEKDYGECFGLSMIRVGETEADSEEETFFPYVKGFNYLFNEKFDIDPCSDHEGFYGLCDDNNIGIPMIFYINDPIGLREMREFHSDENELNCVTLSALASDGIILLPIEKNEYQIKYEKKINDIRNDMINAAKSGDIEAMEQLTLEDMNKFTRVTKRSQREDIFTIVNSFFMPYTVECDKYSVLGEINDVAEMKNKATGESLYYLSLVCNSIEFEVLINKKDLMGVPQKGRRFKGHVWMQGQMDYL